MHQLDIFGEIIEYLDLHFYWNTMTPTHLAYPEPALDRSFGTDPDQDAESVLHLSQRSILLSVMHLQMMTNLQTTLSGEKRCFLLYSTDRPLSGMRITSPMQLPGRKSKQNSSLDVQTDETNFDTEWK